MVEFDMIEHVMSALYGLGIDNAQVHCTNSEIPGLDGSSYGVVLALQSAGVESFETPRRTLIIDKTVTIGDDDRFIRVEPITSDDRVALHVEYQLDYGQDNPIGIETYSATLDASTYATQIAPARTFISATDAAALQESGVATHVTERDLLVFDENGPINNELRFPNECARHKTLDLIGDLALAGIDLVGRVTARRSGHQMNGKMAELLSEMWDQTHQNSQSRAA